MKYFQLKEFSCFIQFKFYYPFMWAKKVKVAMILANGVKIHLVRLSYILMICHNYVHTF